MTESTKSPATRRRFLKKAAAGAATAGALAAPSVSRAQTTSLRFQSTWPSKDIFHEYAQDFAKKVNDMAGGRLKIEVLPSGAVVPPFQLLEARDQGHARRRPRRGGLPLRQELGAGAVGLGPGASAWTPTCCWPGTTTAAARRCSRRSTSRINIDVVSFLYGPMPTQPFGWFKKPMAQASRT